MVRQFVANSNNNVFENVFIGSYFRIHGDDDGRLDKIEICK